jgi:hypothetical protein
MTIYLRPLVQEESLEDTKTDEQLLELIMQGCISLSAQAQRQAFRLHRRFTQRLRILIFNGAKKAVSFEAKWF